MARVTLAIQQVSIAAPILAVTFTAPNGAGAGNGNTVNTGYNPRTFLVVQNLSGTGARTVTIPNVPATRVDGLLLASQSIIVTQAKVGLIWLGPYEYVDSSGNVNIDIDGLDSGNVTWAAIQFPASWS